MSDGQLKCQISGSSIVYHINHSKYRVQFCIGYWKTVFSATYQTDQRASVWFIELTGTPPRHKTKGILSFKEDVILLMSS